MKWIQCINNCFYIISKPTGISYLYILVYINAVNKEKITESLLYFFYKHTFQYSFILWMTDRHM